MVGRRGRGQALPAPLIFFLSLVAATLFAHTARADSHNPRFVDPTDAQYGVRGGPGQASIPTAARQNNTVMVDGYLYATLDNESPYDNTWECKPVEALKLPPGWILAPDSRETIKAIETYTWNAYFGLTESGVRYQTGKHKGGTAAERTFSGRFLEEGQISGEIYADIFGGFKAKDCFARIMIMQSESMPWYTYNGLRYRTLHGDYPMDTERQCLSLPYRKIPMGWVLAPDTADVANMLRVTTWNAYYAVTGSGNRYYTKGQEREESPEGFVPGYLVTDGKGGFKSRDICGRLLLVECPPLTFTGTPHDCWPCNASHSYLNESVTCPAGRHLLCPPYEPDPTFCWECPAGTYSAEGENTCTKCAIGKFSTAVGATSDVSCEECPQGTYQPATGSTTCVKCDPGTYSGATMQSSESTCVAACEANFFSAVAGAGSVLEASCTACPAGKASHPGAPSCTTVPGLHCPNDVGTLSLDDDAGLLNGPSSLAYVPGGLSALVVDRLNHAVREIEILTGAIATVAGTSGTPGYHDNPCDEGIWPVACPPGGVRGTDALFNAPYGIAVARFQSGVAALIADRGNNRIRKLELDIRRGTVTTLAGSGLKTTTNGLGVLAAFDEPTEIVISPDVKFALVTERAGNTVRMIKLRTSEVTTLAGSGTAGYADNVHGALAMFNTPFGIDISPDGKTAFVGDSANHRIRTIDLETTAVGTLAGSGTGGSDDGVGTDATFNAPSGVAVTPDGVSVLVADLSNHLIRAVDITTTQVTTLAGDPGTPGNVDGVLGISRLNEPRGITVSPDGHTALFCGEGTDMIRTLGTCPPASLYHYVEIDSAFALNISFSDFTFTHPLRFATITNDDPADINQQCRATVYTTLPGGWILAPNNTVSIEAIKRFGDAAYYGVVATGVLHFSRLAPDTEYHYSYHTSQNNYSNQLEIDGNGGYRTVHDCARVIIQRCPEGTFSHSHDTCEQCALTTCTSPQVLCPAGSAKDSCGACPGGQYEDSGACVDCAAGTYSRLPGVAGEASCANCWPGSYAPAAGATTCLACPAGKYSDTAGSTTCKDTCDHQFFSTAVGATAAGQGCEPCPLGNSSHKGSFRCVKYPTNIVEVAAYPDEGLRFATLYATLNNELPADDLPECKYQIRDYAPLPAGWVLAPENPQTMYAIRNYFWNAYHAISAAGNRFMTAVYEETSVDPGGLQTDGWGAYRPRSDDCYARLMIMGCQPGTYTQDDEFDCTPCPANTDSHSASASCSPLPSIYVEHDGSRWADLNQGIVPAGDGTVACPSNYELVPGGWILASEFDAGAEHVIRNNMWNARYVSTAYGRAFPAKDFEADAATTQNGTLATVHSDGRGGIRTDCSPSVNGADRIAMLIKECGPGTYSSSRYECKTCAPGQFSVGGNSSCSFCPRGTYNQLEGSSGCTECDAGYVSEEVGSTVCTICPAGLYSGPGAAVCRPCLAGSYSTVVGAVDPTVCQQCPSQTFSSEPGSSSCTDCFLDGYSSVGASYCVRDPTYTVVPENSVIKYATIWNDVPSGTELKQRCQPRQLPDGWIISPNNGASIAVIKDYPWQSAYLVVGPGAGIAYPTGIDPDVTATINPGDLQTDETSDPWGIVLYSTTECTHRILIQECPSKERSTAYACA